MTEWIPSSHLTFHEVGVKPALLPVEDGLKGWMVVVDVEARG